MSTKPSQQNSRIFPGFPGVFLTVFQDLFALNVYPNKFVHTIIIWNVQFHLAYFYLTTSLLTFLTEADIYWAGSLLPEILLTVQILSTQSTKYRQMLTNIDKCRQISTLMLFFQDSQQNSRVFPGFPGSF